MCSYAGGNLRAQLQTFEAFGKADTINELLVVVQGWPWDWETRRIVPELVLTSRAYPPDAIRALEWYLERDPYAVDARIGLIGFELVIGRFVEANANYEIVRKVAPRSEYVIKVNSALAALARAASERAPSSPEPHSTH